jgi:hypothetical protein
LIYQPPYSHTSLVFFQKARKREERMEVTIQADKRVIIVSAVVGLFGFLGAILGFAAEGAHETVSTTALRLIIHE